MHLTVIYPGISDFRCSNYVDKILYINALIDWITIVFGKLISPSESKVTGGMVSVSPQ